MKTQQSLRALALVAVSVLVAPVLGAQSAAPGSIPVIFDTDFSLPPQDDGLALILALNSPELKMLGITTVAGNDTMQRATSDALRELEIVGHPEVPVYRGANRPLVHTKTPWDETKHGKWWSDEQPAVPPGGFAKKQAEKESAVDFLVYTVNANPGKVSILALGPLTNIAMAIRLDPQFAKNVKQIAIMGGAIGSLEFGSGNMTPNAEFNIWVDPEAAWVVVHSGIPLVFTPLNVTAKTRFSRQYFDQIVAANTPATQLIKERMLPAFERNPKREGFMYDELTVAALADPTLVKTMDMYVDVDINHGPDYGATIGALKQWADGEQSVKTTIQYDVDFDRFIKMFIERVTKK